MIQGVEHRFKLLYGDLLPQRCRRKKILWACRVTTKSGAAERNAYQSGAHALPGRHGVKLESSCPRSKAQIRKPLESKKKSRSSLSDAESGSVAVPRSKFDLIWRLPNLVISGTRSRGDELNVRAKKTINISIMKRSEGNPTCIA